MTLNEKIVEILRRHPEGGEKFFDALDFMIRGDKDILEDYIKWVSNYYGKSRMDIGIVLTGSFGRVVASRYLHWLYENFGNVLIVNGGIRSGSPVELPVTDIPLSSYILLDDSYYSGKTRKSIEAALKKLRPDANIGKTFVIYDGSKIRNTDVLGMYRYYNKDGRSS